MPALGTHPASGSLPEPRRDPGAALQGDVRPPGDRRRHPGHLHRLARRAVRPAGGSGRRRRLRRRHLLRLLQAAPRRSALPADRRGEAGGGEPLRAPCGLPSGGPPPGEPAHLLPPRLQGRAARRGEARARASSPTRALSAFGDGVGHLLSPVQGRAGRARAAHRQPQGRGRVRRRPDERRPDGADDGPRGRRVGRRRPQPRRGHRAALHPGPGHRRRAARTDCPATSSV